MTHSSAETASQVVSKRIERPLVIVGAVRSGTTMLHLMLGGHPRLHILGEFEESVRWLPDKGWIDVDEYRRRLEIDRVFRSRGGRLPTARTYPEAVHELAGQYFNDLADEQIPGFVIHNRIDRVADVWPDARVVHIVRDPRDVARSCIGMGWAGHVWQASAIWEVAEQRFDRLASRLSDDQCIRVRYEDLVRDPRAELTRLLEFVGLGWVDEIYGHIDASTYDRPDPRFIEQWRRKLTRREVELVEARCGGSMVSRGYEPMFVEPRPPGRAEAIGLAVHHRWKRWRFSCRRYGLPLALLRSVTSRMPSGSTLRKTVQLRVNEIERAHLK